MNDTGYPRIESVESLEEFLREQERRENAANADILDKQREITWGSYFVKYAENMIIFGRVWSLEEHQELLATTEVDEGDRDQEIVMIQNSHARNYRQGDHYSAVLPQGEYGSTHLVSLWPISQEEFLAARDANWQPSIELLQRIHSELGAALQEANRKEESS